MDPITRQAIAVAGGAGGSEGLYVDDVFSTFLYKGTSSNQAISNGLDLSTEGGMVWLKARNQNYDHWVFDTERGVTKGIRPNETAGEYTLTDYFNSFNTNGFTVGSNGSTNYSGINFASWSFRKAPGFFDVVTFTGTGSAQNISHSLGSAPGMIVVKKVGSTDAGSWNVYHRSNGANGVIYLNATHANSVDNTVWNNTAPTSSVFTVGADAGVNANGSTYVAYIFAHDDQSFGTDSDEAIIKCGSFSSNSSGHYTVSLGFEPQFLLIKSTSSGDWFIADTMRTMAMSATSLLVPNTTSTDNLYTGEGYLYPIPDGFKSTRNLLGSSQTFIYMAIRRPHKPPTAGTEVFKPVTRTGTESAGFITGVGFAPDLLINKDRNSQSTADILFYDKLRSLSKYINSNGTSAESSGNSAPLLFTNDGLELTTGVRANGPGRTQIDYYLRRAPGFFDVVAYTGTGSAQTVNHNLGAVPELMIVKKRSSADEWPVYSSATGNTKYMTLNTDSSVATLASYWNSTTPTSTQFSLGDRGENNLNNATFIAYLFASLSGISKVGSYSGTGNDVNVDCGFTAGARFVMVKRTDGGGGNWFVWDTARGIVSGNDPYLLMNSSNAEVTNTDFIDPLNAGFTVTSSAPSDLNANGGTYLFLAIA